MADTGVPARGRLILSAEVVVVVKACRQSSARKPKSANFQSLHSAIMTVKAGKSIETTVVAIRNGNGKGSTMKGDQDVH